MKTPHNLLLSAYFFNPVLLKVFQSFFLIGNILIFNISDLKYDFQEEKSTDNVLFLLIYWYFLLESKALIFKFPSFGSLFSSL